MASRERVLLEHLIKRYGPLLDATEVQEVLRFRTAEAVVRSIHRGGLGPISRVAHRRELLVRAVDVVSYLLQSSAADVQSPEGARRRASEERRESRQA
jgi:hypothetical protein